MNRNKKIIFIISLSLNLTFVLLLLGGIGNKIYQSNWGKKQHSHHQIARKKMREFRKTPLIKAEIVELKKSYRELYKILELEPFDRLATSKKMNQINQSLNTIKDELIKVTIDFLEELPSKERIIFAKKFIRSTPLLQSHKKSHLKRGKGKHKE